MELWNYLGHKIKISTINGSMAIGLADIYIPAEDNEDEIASLILAPNDNDIMREFCENEIASIEIIADETPFMANAV